MSGGRIPEELRVAVLAALAACRFVPGSLGGDAAPGDDDGGGSGDAALVDPDTAPDAVVLGAWGTPAPILTGTGDDDPTLTADLLELYFNRSSDIYVATRATLLDSWSAPVRVDELSASGATDTTPEITGNGLTIFVGSARTGTAGAGDIWVATRANRMSAWSTPVRVAELSSTSEDAASAPTDDLRAIVFISPRSGGSGNSDIYYSERAQPTDAWGTPVNLTTVNTGSDDFSPMLSQDRLTLYFDSGRSGNSELYITSRASTAAPFGTPALITELETPAAESDPWVSPDQRHMFFTRNGTLYYSTR